MSTYGSSEILMKGNWLVSQRRLCCWTRKRSLSSHFRSNLRRPPTSRSTLTRSGTRYLLLVFTYVCMHVWHVCIYLGYVVCSWHQLKPPYLPLLGVRADWSSGASGPISALRQAMRDPYLAVPPCPPPPRHAGVPWRVWKPACYSFCSHLAGI